MSKISEVKIIPSSTAAYGQIIRAAISGMSACSRVKDQEHLEMFRNIFRWAEVEYTTMVTAACKHGPAQG